MAILSKEGAQQRIQKLIEKYDSVRTSGQIKKYSEEDTKTNFIMPLFEALGWNIFNRDEVTAEETITGKRVDYGFYLIGVAKFYLEAKALRADIHSESYAKQAIRYSWNKGVTWAVLTDFESLIVFNALSPEKSLHGKKYFEIPYTDYLNRFEQLWLLSKESFGKNLLDQEAEKHGKKIQKLSVTENLAKDLNECRRLLTQAFISWNEKVPHELIEEGVQKLLDRLIFIRVAEDRQIEPITLRPIGNEWLASGRKEYLYQTMVGKFRELDKIYNSNIFSPHAFEGWQEHSDATKEVIDILYGKNSYFEYDFSVIPADVLGAVYENYLEYKLQKAKTKNLFGLSVELDKSARKRKDQGIYYTPKYIVDFIVKETLGPILDKCNSISDLQKVKVLDPACGSGSFLVAAFNFILDKYKEFGSNPQDPFVRAQVLRQNIYGVDLDQQAVELTRLNLLLNTFDSKIKLPDLADNVKNGNSLISEGEDKYKPFNFQREFKEVFVQGGFDAIIGNPPYIFARSGNFDKQTKEYFYKNFPLANYQLNTYLLFTDRSFRLLKKDGHMGFIVPNTWLTIDTFSKLRKFLLEETGGLQIINIFDKVFGGANVDTCLLIFKKGKPNNVRLGEFRDGQLVIVGDSPVSQFKKNNYIINIALAKSKDRSAILDKVKENSKNLEEYATIKSGFVAYETGKGNPPQTNEMKNQRIYHSNKKEGKGWYKYLEGKDVKRYQVDWSGKWVKYGNWLAAPRTIDLYQNPRILVRQIPSPPPHSINAIFVNENMLMNDRNSMIILYFKINYLFVLAVLNAEITTFWFVNTFDKFQRKTFPQFKVKELASFPIPNTDKSTQENLARKAQQMLDLNKKLRSVTPNTDKYAELKHKIEQLDSEIDQEIYKLYALTKEEIKIVENGKSAR